MERRGDITSDRCFFVRKAMLLMKRGEMSGDSEASWDVANEEGQFL
jgi:hypothetical protein